MARRSLSQNKWYSAITIIGLATALTVVLLIGLYINNELSFDRFNQKADRIYLINSDISFSLQGLQTAAAPTPLGATLKRDFPEVEEAVRLGKYQSCLVKSTHENIREQAVLLADSTLFNVFTLPILAGNPTTALTQPNSVVITERMAKKYFGSTNALNKVLIFNNKESKQVSAIIKDIPAQSHFQADFILPLWLTNNAKVDKWGNHIFNTYILLRPGTNPQAVEGKFEKILQTYMDPALRRFFNTSLAEARKQGNYFRYSLIPLTDIHLHSARAGELMPNGSIEYVYIFTGIALFILLIAVVNFINLTTARSIKRAREIGVRKVLGSSRIGLISQFLSESLLIAIISMLIAFVMVLVLLPFFNSLTAENLSGSDLLNFPNTAGLLLFTALIGIMAGVYPAFYLSSFQPANAIKGTVGSLPNGQNLRSSLVVFQFAMSVLLIIATLLINQQLRFIQGKNLGFEKEQIIILKTAEVPENQLRTFKEIALQNSKVKAATISSFLPVTSERNGDYWYPEGQTDQKYSVTMQEWEVDEDYLTTYKMTLLQGRYFVKGQVADSGRVVINESAAKQLGYKQPVGKTIHKQGGELLTIIGVVKDFHYESLRTKIEPLCFMLDADIVSGKNTDALSLRLETEDMASSLAALENKWKKVAPGQPFEYAFLNESFDDMYRAEQRVQVLFTGFTTIAILISCLGLFGLATFTAEQRTKEIGVRKVLGASVASIVTLLSRDFLKPVLFAIVIATPIAWYIMNRWLQDFNYRIEIEWWVFALAGMLAVGIALITISFQSIKAALMNPVRSLKSE
ncbi:ABC transporter permease [Dyadobacter sp. LJ53]|uniref:ABC transporter permease n=1 Tax=Dyadobacter chenwenxiniae TaxID=2906456 RepID=UPI001F3CF9B6|nr:ABC transporter permease [Dyadobacter chenwenxiniae]MCF0053613.1 ABC transporter permease [Dyadobacter chenwenxiniae]